MREPARAGARSWLPPLTLVAVTAVFGWTFVVVKDALAEYPVLPFLGLRFGIAAITLLLLLRTWPRRTDWRVGAPIAAVLALGYLLQTQGMVTIPPGIAGLLTGLFVVFTPILDRLLYGARLVRKTWISVAVALLGTALLTGAATGFGLGDLLVLLAALCFAAQIVLLSHSRSSVARLSLVQILVCALLLLLLGTSRGVPYPALSGPVAYALVITGVLASALAVLAQTWAQRHMTASRAGLVLAAEPAFALLFAVLLAGERLSLVQLLGAVLLVAAIAGHEISFSRATD
ncbi:MAG: DMT family transporter [Candidatus Dormibacteria bacterium]